MSGKLLAKDRNMLNASCQLQVVCPLAEAALGYRSSQTWILFYSPQRHNAVSCRPAKVAAGGIWISAEGRNEEHLG